MSGWEGKRLLQVVKSCPSFPPLNARKGKAGHYLGQ